MIVKQFLGVNMKKILLHLVLLLFTICIYSCSEIIARRYASDVKVEIKNILESSKIYYSENKDFPKDVETLNEEGYANVLQSFLNKWQFSIDIINTEVGISGSITAESTEEMNGGPGKIIIFNLQTGLFQGYGCKRKVACKLDAYVDEYDSLASDLKRAIDIQDNDEILIISIKIQNWTLGWKKLGVSPENCSEKEFMNAYNRMNDIALEIIQH
tara:strand:- start:102 stop:743 length:642 start_codon:yes stop_codon:yes gene_type:complete